MSASAKRRSLLAAFIAGPALGLALPARLNAQDEKPFSPFVTSPQVTVLRMLSIARVGAQDHVIDLGSGDGRIPIVAATRFGATGWGVDLDPKLVAMSNRNAEEAGVADRVRFERGNVFETDVRKATVVTLYLLPPIVQGLRAGLLRQLRPGSRIVSHDFPFEGWQADASETFFAPEKNSGRGGDSTIFLYVVPAVVHGRWQVAWSGSPAGGAAPEPMELRIGQSNQFVEVDLAVGGRVLEGRDGRIGGDRLRFNAVLPERPGGPPARPWQFDGRVDGDVIVGQARDERGSELGWKARRTAAR